jgi:hypothetical protein
MDMAQDRTAVKLGAGLNELPQLYNPTVSSGGTLRIHAAVEPHVETDPGHALRSPDATTVAFRMDLKDAIRLAVQISEWAQRRGTPLPKGVLYRETMH